MDAQGKLSRAEKENLIAELVKRQTPPGREMPCEVCGASKWFIGDHLVTPNTYIPGGGITFGGPSYTLAQLICGNCGNTKLLNAYALRVLDPEKPPTPEESGG